MTDYEDLLKNYSEMLDDDDDAAQTTLESQPSLAEAIEALKAQEAVRTSRSLLYGLSGLIDKDIPQLEPVWNSLGIDYRRKLFRELIEFSEINIEVDYRTLGIYGLDDPDPGVREAAIELLWEDQSLEVMSRLVNLAAHETSPQVRAAAATGLGRYILLGELGDLPEGETVPAQNVVVQLLQDPNEVVTVQRRALEAIANCSHPIVPAAIEDAYNSLHQEMRVSAIYAMGKSYDQRWHDIVLEELESSDPEICYEAAKAAGELEIDEAVPKLALLMIEDDREIIEVVVWSLGEIGGKEAMRILEAVAEKAEDEDDEAMMLAVEDAIGNASLSDGLFGDLDLDDFDLE